jgi:hypothetical protein
MDLNPKSVLEVGAARGYLVKRFEAAGIPAKGLEISKHCHLTRVTDSVVEWDICQTPWPFKDGEFDLCYSVAVMEHIPEEGISSLFVIARTDLNDLEVYPYEVLKWILRMRSNEKDEQPKILKIHEGKGHFTTTSESRAEDLFLLKRWIKNIGGKYNQMEAPSPNAEKMMAGGKRNRMNRTQRKNRMNRVNRVERKNRVNRSERKNRMNRNRSERNRVNRH